MTSKETIEQLYVQHYRSMKRLACAMLHDEAESKDVINDIFARILDGRIPLRKNPTEGFFLVAVRNACLNRIRSLSIRQRALRLLPIEDEEPLPATLEAECRRLRQGMATALTDQQRQVVEGKFLEKLSYQQMGERMGISKVAVFKHMKHAMARLRDYLNEHE